MAELFSNNSFTILSGAFAAAATELDVAAGTGIKFPTIVAPDYAYCVVTRASDGLREVVKVTARPVSADADKFTVERASQDIDGITAVALDFVSGDTIFATPTKTFYEALSSTTAIQDGSSFYAAAVGTNTITATFSPVPSTVGAGHRVVIKVAVTNTGAVTFDAGPGAVAINKLKDGALVALVDSDMVAGTLAVLRHNGTVWILENPAVRVSGHGQCRLDYVSTILIKLLPKNGNQVLVKIGSEWVSRTIPSAGITLPNTGLNAATLYYIYMYDNAGTLTLVASTTGHSTDATSGVEIETGDATRTLVGMVYMNTGTPGVFANASNKRYTLSWFNRKRVPLNTGGYSSNTASTTLIEVDSVNRAIFISWGDDAILLQGNGYQYNTLAGAWAQTRVFKSSGGAALTNAGSACATQDSVANFFGATSIGVAFTPAENINHIGLGLSSSVSGTAYTAAVIIGGLIQI